MSDGVVTGIIIVLVLAVLLIVAASCIKIVPQANAIVLERLGAYRATWSTGIHFKIPFIERVARKVNLKEQVVDFPPQPVITKDNVTMRIDTVVFYQITDSKGTILDEGDCEIREHDLDAFVSMDIPGIFFLRLSYKIADETWVDKFRLKVG